MARADGEEAEHLRTVDESLSRMGEMIDDLLTLAREGTDVGEREVVALPAVTRDAWDGVATDGDEDEDGDEDHRSPTLVVDTEAVIYADRSRLRQLFENLFRNSLEHGPGDVTVTVADAPDGDGFTVADDAGGLPSDVAADPFGEAEGLGLVIVERIVAGHDWTVSVDSDDTGTTFTVDNVVHTPESAGGVAGAEGLALDEDSSATDESARTDRAAPASRSRAATHRRHRPTETVRPEATYLSVANQRTVRTAVSNALRRATHVLGARSGDEFERVSAERVVRHWLTRELDAAADDEHGARSTVDDEHGARSTVDDEHGVPTPTGTEPPPSTGLADRQLGERSTTDAGGPDSPRGTPSGVGEDGRTTYAALVDALLSVKPGAATFLGRHPPSAWFRTTLSPERLSRLHPVAGPPDLSWRAVATDGTLASVARRHYREGPAPLRRAGVDVEVIDHYTERLAAADTLDAVVIRTDRGATPWLVADGNHRVVAAARHRLATGEYEPLPAFVGVSPNPVLEPLVARLRGLRRRLWGRRVAEPRR